MESGDDATNTALASVLHYERRIAELEAIVVAQAETIEAQRLVIERLEAKVAELERRLGQNSGNSGTPPSRDPAGERQRQAEQRQRRSEQSGAPKQRRGKQRGARGTGVEMSANPDEIVDHRPERCEGCGAELGGDTTTASAPVR